jgi:hypothetical protein
MISVESYYDRGDGRLAVEMLLDGEPWRAGDVPSDLVDGDETVTHAALVNHLEARADALRCDRHRQVYPAAVVRPEEGESILDAWTRVLVAGVDDAGEVLE